MASKTKTGLLETPTRKASSATPRVGRVSRVASKSEADSPTPLQNPRLSIDRSPRTPKLNIEADSPSPLQNRPLSIDRSPRTVTPKPSIERRSPKVPTPTDKPTAKTVKGSDLKSQLDLVQEDLKKAKEKIALIEKEKHKALEELKESQKLAEGANEKFRDALVAQKRAEESSEIEKFRAVEMEQAGIEAAQRKEDEWMRELEAVRNQHALDVAALLSTTQELQKTQLDLAMACDAKNQALSHADDATKLAEIHVEKVEILSAELARLKALLDSKTEAEANENNKMVLQLREEADSLRQELDKAKVFEGKLSEKEASIEQLNVQLEAAKMAESYACSLVEEWKHRVEELEMRVAEANKLERSASESLDSMMKQLEQNNGLLHDAESEVAVLKEKVGMLERTIGRQKDDLEESEHQLGLVTEERSEMEKMVESLKVELQTTKEEKLSALNKEKLAASSIQSLLEEKNKLVNDMKTSKEEEEKSKKAMESLASALHEVSAEARDAKEKLLCIQIEHETCEDQMENLRLVMKATNGKYDTMLNDARNEVDMLTAAIEQSKNENQNAKAEWEQKELHLVDCLKQLEAENNAMRRENDKLVNLLKQTEEEVDAAKDEEYRLKDNLTKVEADVTCLQDSLADAKDETVKLKESLLDKEEELHRLIQEKEELQASEAASMKRIEELSMQLEEAIAKYQPVENGELSDTEKEYDLLPKVVEFSEENGHGAEERRKMEIPPEDEECKRESSHKDGKFVHGENVHVETPTKIEGVNGKKEEDTKDREVDSVESEFKMWENCKIEKKEFSPEREAEQESLEEELESKADGGESFDQVNGVNSSENMEDGAASPSKQQSQKKKKPLLRKFGSLLKKKGASNTK